MKQLSLDSSALWPPSFFPICLPRAQVSEPASEPADPVHICNTHMSVLPQKLFQQDALFLICIKQACVAAFPKQTKENCGVGSHIRAHDSEINCSTSYCVTVHCKSSRLEQNRQRVSLDFLPLLTVRSKKMQLILSNSIIIINHWKASFRVDGSLI